MSERATPPVRPALTTSKPPPTYLELLGDDSHGGVRRTAFGVAIAVHLIAMAITVPQLYSDDLEEQAEDQKVFMVTPLKFRPPPPPPPEPPPPPRASVPMPDPTPDGPEPIPFDEPPPEISFSTTDLSFTVPDGPPAPAPTEPPLPVVSPPDLQLQVGVDVEPPERLHFVKPEYTRAALRAGIRGAVVLQLTIDKQGNVTDLVVRKKLTFGLTEAAVSAVRQWRFSPTLVDGRPVELLYVVTVQFEPSSRQR